MSEEELKPNLLKDHACGQSVNEDGRVIMNCNQCYEDVYAEGRYSGYKFALNDIKTSLLDLINNEFKILSIDNESEIVAKWKTAHLFNQLLNNAISKLDKSNSTEHAIIRDKWLRRVMTEEELEDL